MKKSNKTERHKKAVLEALEKSLGIATTACRMVGIGRTTYYEWLKTDKEFANKVKELENVALDFSESQLHSLIKDKNVSAVIFHLKTKGRKRGYVERHEHDHTSKGEQIYLTPDEQIEKLKELTQRIKQAKEDRGDDEL
jgi:hypothetical protein